MSIADSYKCLHQYKTNELTIIFITMNNRKSIRGLDFKDIIHDLHINL